MGVYECWESQREALRNALREQSDMAQVGHQVRHAVMQTEQNALAEQTDEVLRQQTGVLFSMVKTAVGFLEAPVAATTWVARARKEEKRPMNWAFTLAAAALTIVCGLCCYAGGMTLGWVSALAALAADGLSLAGARGRRAASDAARDDIKVTLTPDADRLLGVLDAQMRAIDRCSNDFGYLNEKLRQESKGQGTAMVARVSDLLEALYECDPEAREPAEDAVRQMLRDMGLRALDYSEESRKLFTALPSKNETRTLSPAIVSAEDYRLLRRGTAAVKTGAA